MLHLAEIHRLVRTLQDDRSSPVADTVAGLWGHAPGAARHHRTSDSHVFVLPDRAAYLRFVPVGHRDLRPVAALMASLHARGLAVTPPVPSRSGALVETVPTALGDMDAMVVRAAPGVSIELDALTPARASLWGAALARLHAVPGDPRLPRDPDGYGLVHGDFELDNLAWDGDTVTAYDFDGAGRSWFMADIAAAVRDVPPGPLFDAFIDGYRSVRFLGDEDLALLPLFADRLVAATRDRIRAALDEPAPDDPDWLIKLRQKLQRYVYGV